MRIAHGCRTGIWINVFPVLSPLAIDPAHPFPFIANAGFSLALELEDPTGRQLDALVPIPSQIDRFVRVGTNPIRLLPLEELILAELDSLFPGYACAAPAPFRCCATAIWRSRKKPKTLCANSKSR